MIVRLNKLAIIAATAFGLADFVFSWNPLAAAPYLANRHLPVFRTSPALGIGLIAEAVNGWLAVLAFALVQPALTGSWLKRGALFGLVLWGFWVVSGTFSAFVWLDIPASLALTNVAFGLPKCVAIGSALAWAWEKMPDIENSRQREFYKPGTTSNAVSQRKT